MKRTFQYWRYAVMVMIAVLLSFELHELVHYFTGEYLGNKMGMTFNSCFPVAGYYSGGDRDYATVSATGPLFTILQAIIFYLLLNRKNNYYLYPFLFIPFFMRCSAMIISFKNPNDEARVSNFHHLGTFTLPLIVSALLFYFVYRISRKYSYSKRFQLFTFLLTLFFYSAIILTDQYFHIRIL